MSATRRIRLVAIREYRHHAKSKGFWLMMVIVPLVAALAALIPQWVQENKPTRAFAVIDQADGTVLAAIDAALANDEQKRTLAAVKDYAAEHIPAESIPLLSPFAPARGQITGDDVKAFLAFGGLAKVNELLPVLARPGSPPFVPPAPRFARINIPSDIDTAADPAAIGAALSPYLRIEKPIEGERPPWLTAAVIVPADYRLTAPTTAIQYWSIYINDFELESLIESALTAEAKRAMYREQGMSNEAVAAIEARRVAMQAFNPDKREAGGAIELQDRLLNFVPAALAMLLWMSIFTVANLLLLGVIEERSNRLIEVLLSSVSAGEFMAGKLFGIAMIGLTILFAWIVVALLILANGSDPTVQFANSAIQLIFSGPYIPAFAFYFVVGYLTIASIFLGLGSVCNSQQEAQALLTPLVLTLMLPFFLLLPMIQDPNGPIATVIGWIPIYTPFVMMVRLSTNPGWVELVATGLLTLAFSGLVVWGMARLFKSAVLRTGQPPRLVEMWRMMIRQDR
ncbi:MAG: ABC transporter permease [Alphaproteobacteria bacterium]|nr:ABC transporter permease [Alphaproteobacteria bacterium]